MNTRVMKVLALLIVGGVYWQVVCQATGTREPWDAATYWSLWYPLSFALSAVAGYLLKEDGWLAGGMLIFAQLPIMWLNNGTGPLFAVGLLFMCVLAIPAVAISLLTGLFAMRVRSA